jgi:hypothetical protein
MPLVFSRNKKCTSSFIKESCYGQLVGLIAQIEQGTKGI